MKLADIIKSHEDHAKQLKETGGRKEYELAYLTARHLRELASIKRNQRRKQKTLSKAKHHRRDKYLPDAMRSLAILTGWDRIRDGTTRQGDLVWCTDKHEFVPVDSINEYVSEYICVIRPK